MLLCRGESTGIIPTARILINFGIYRNLIGSRLSNRICVVMVSVLKSSIEFKSVFVSYTRRYCVLVGARCGMIIFIVLGLTCISIRIGCAVFRRCAEAYLGFISIIAA